MEPLHIDSARIRGLTLTGELYATITNNVFQNCDFNGVSFTRSNIANNVFNNCAFEGTRWNDTIIHGNHFDNCTAINLEGSRNVQFVGCYLNGSKDKAEELFKKMVELMP